MTSSAKPIDNLISTTGRTASAILSRQSHTLNSEFVCDNKQREDWRLARRPRAALATDHRHGRVKTLADL